MLLNTFQSRIFPIRSTYDNDYSNNNIEKTLTPESTTTSPIIIDSSREIKLIKIVFAISNNKTKTSDLLLIKISLNKLSLAIIQ